MRQTKLILIEGLPGSGKSTLAQFLTRRLAEEDVAVRWWYEEEVGHPVYVFRDADELRRTVERLNRGDYERVIAEAVEQWRRFAEVVAGDDIMFLLDSCLLGYLTWSLFPLNVPTETIEGYVAAVEDLIAPLNPCLIYLHQHDVGASLRRIRDRRGPATEARLLQQSTQSPYGRAHGLTGFSGMVDYWAAYQSLTDAMVARSRLHKIAIETGDGEWTAHQRQAMGFLGLGASSAAPISVSRLGRFAGRYEFGADDAPGVVTVSLVNGSLILSDMPEVWRDTPLNPIAVDRFEVESLPLEVSFERGGGSEAMRMIISGPALFGGPIPRDLRRIGP